MRSTLRVVVNVMMAIVFSGCGGQSISGGEQAELRACAKAEVRGSLRCGEADNRPLCPWSEEVGRDAFCPDPICLAGVRAAFRACAARAAPSAGDVADCIVECSVRSENCQDNARRQATVCAARCGSGDTVCINTCSSLVVELIGGCSIGDPSCANECIVSHGGSI